MSKKDKKDDVWWAKNFPTVHARAVADKAIDDLDPREPMTKYIDVWIQAYVKAGGKTNIKI